LNTKVAAMCQNREAKWDVLLRDLWENLCVLCG
jgi:hypothetical protein